MGNLKRSELSTAIRRIVCDNSGGLKFTKLVTELAEEGFYGFTPDDVLDVINTDVDLRKTLSVLRYVWRECNREKLFIFTKL